MLIKCKHTEQQRYEEAIRKQFTDCNTSESREAAEIIARGVQATVTELKRRELSKR